MRRVLVTGANRGIGHEFVRQHLDRGDRVYATCRKAGHAHELTKLALAHPGRLTILPLDLAKPASITELERELHLVTDALDVLVNNAGMLVSGERWGTLEAKSFADTFATNVTGPMLLTQALTPLLERGTVPRVASVSSGLGSLAGVKEFGTPSYSTSKAVLNMAMRQAAQALASHGIVAVVLSPGWVKTDMGGAGAVLEPSVSVRGMIAVIDALRPEDTGRFLGHDGNELPW